MLSPDEVVLPRSQLDIWDHEKGAVPLPSLRSTSEVTHAFFRMGKILESRKLERMVADEKFTPLVIGRTRVWDDENFNKVGDHFKSEMNGLKKRLFASSEGVSRNISPEDGGAPKKKRGITMRAVRPKEISLPSWLTPHAQMRWALGVTAEAWLKGRLAFLENNRDQDQDDWYEIPKGAGLHVSADGEVSFRIEASVSPTDKE